MDEKVIDTRLPVDTEVAPVSIKEEDALLLDEVKDAADDLEKGRAELGRLFQILSNIRDKVDHVEKSLTEKRKELSNKYDLGVDGSWVIDFENKEFVKVEKRVPKTV